MTEYSLYEKLYHLKIHSKVLTKIYNVKMYGIILTKNYTVRSKIW